MKGGAEMIASLIHQKNKYVLGIEALLKENIYKCSGKEDALKILPEAEIIITIGGADSSHIIPMDEELLAVCTKLKLLLSLSAGVESLPLEALLARGVRVCNTKGAHAVPIAEYVLGGMLIFSHRYHMFFRRQVKREWGTFSQGDGIEGKTLCVVGAGSIGQAIGKKAKALDMQVIGIKRHPEALPYFDRVLEAGRLHEGLSEADYVALATPLTPETRRLMGAEEFQKMKDTAVFINISRGNTVDEAALVQALIKKQIAGAVLDVFQEEPLPQDSQLWQMENVIITPHIAGGTFDAERNSVQLTYENILRHRNGQEPVNQIAGI
jgi:phosphoglycerate dehydrogenase-like enzyme